MVVAEYVLVGHFTQDALENFFFQIRHRHALPNAREFKVAIRLFSFSQFEGSLRCSIYERSDQHHLINCCNERNKCTQNSADFSHLLLDKLATALTAEEDLIETTKAALCYLIGIILYKVSKQNM